MSTSSTRRFAGTGNGARSGSDAFFRGATAEKTSAAPGIRTTAGMAAIASLAAIFAIAAQLPLRARDSNDAASKEAVSALELSGQLSAFYKNFTGVIEVTLGRASEGVRDSARLRTLTLAKLRLARACRAAAFQLDPRNALVDTWSLCVQLRLYAAGDAPVRDLGLEPPALALLRDASLRLERDIVLVASQYFPPGQLSAASATVEQFCKAHPLSSAHAITPPPPLKAAAKDGGLGIGWLLSLPLAPFHAMEGVDHTAQAVADFARVVDSVDRTVSDLPMETAWETEILLLDLKRDLSILLDEKTAQLNGALAATLREAIDRLALRAVEIAAAIFILSLLYHVITRRLFRRKT